VSFNLLVTVGTPLVSLAAFLVLGTLYTLPHVFRGLGGEKLQRRSPPFAPSLRRGLAFALVNGTASLLLSLAIAPLYAASGIHGGPLPGAGTILLQVALFLVVDDALFYAAHRLLHTPWLFRRVHAWHHRIHAPFALTGAIMHPVEWLLISGMVVVVPLATGMHLAVFWLCVILRQWGNAEFHAGVHGPWSILGRLPGAGGVRHHDTHHARMRGNYAALFWFWDRVFRTELS
jgi:4-alpha-methyl-delta7-sterol-4alpha-methyl oxidase